MGELKNTIHESEQKLQNLNQQISRETTKIKAIKFKLVFMDQKIKNMIRDTEKFQKELIEKNRTKQ